TGVHVILLGSGGLGGGAVAEDGVAVAASLLGVVAQARDDVLLDLGGVGDALACAVGDEAAHDLPPAVTFDGEGLAVDGDDVADRQRAALGLLVNLLQAEHAVHVGRAVAAGGEDDFEGGGVLGVWLGNGRNLGRVGEGVAGAEGGSA